jgi:hypothetical protein
MHSSYYLIVILQLGAIHYYRSHHASLFFIYGELFDIIIHRFLKLGRQR